jgi:hypothetical protein
MRKLLLLAVVLAPLGCHKNGPVVPTNNPPTAQTSVYDCYTGNAPHQCVIHLDALLAIEQQGKPDYPFEVLHGDTVRWDSGSLRDKNGNPVKFKFEKFKEKQETGCRTISGTHRRPFRKKFDHDTESSQKDTVVNSRSSAHSCFKHSIKLIDFPAAQTIDPHVIIGPVNLAIKVLPPTFATSPQ